MLRLNSLFEENSCEEAASLSFYIWFRNSYVTQANKDNFNEKQFQYYSKKL